MNEINILFLFAFTIYAVRILPQIILLVGFLLMNLFSSAQLPVTLRSQFFSEESGLSNKNVYDFAQDQKGFMWIATSNGLNRFDGKSFKVYKKNYSDSNSLLDNMIIRIAIDQKDQIWIGYASEGLSCYNQENRTFTHFLPDTTKPGTILSGQIDEIYIDNNNHVWVGIAKQGIMKLDQSTGTFDNFGLLPFVSKERSINMQLHYNRITQIIGDSTETIWMGAGDGFYSLNTNTREFKVYRFTNEPENINAWKPDVFNTICKLNDSVFFLGGWGTGVNRYDLKQNKWTNYLINPSKPFNGNNNIINYIEKKSENELWIATNDTNLSIFNIEEQKFYHLSQEQTAANRFISNGMGKLYTDRSGDLWIGHNAGFHIINQSKAKFDFVPIKVTYSNNSSYYHIVDVFKDSISGQKLLSTTWADGLNVIAENGFRKQLNYTKASSIQKNQLGSMVFKDSRNTLWVISSEFLYQYNRSTSELVDIPQPIPDTSIKAIPYFADMIEDENENLWISTHRHGVYVYNINTQKYSQLFHVPGNDQSLLSNIITGITFDQRGDLWIGYKLHGVTHYSVKDKKFTHYRSNKGNINHLIDDRVLCLATDKSGKILVGTYSGLSILDPNSTPAIVNNLINDREFLGITVSDIMVDDSGNVWMVTSNGIAVINSQDKTARTFTRSDGIDFIYESMLFSKAYDGELYMGTFGGYYKFTDSLAINNSKPADVMLTYFKAGETEINFEKELATKGKISLKASENLFIVEFISLNYKNPEKVSYRYRLNGIDQSWRSTGTRGFASYNNLPGGNFVFEVQALLAGKWSDVTTVPVFISTPFYKTTWFNLGAALLIAGAIYALYRFRIKSIEKTEAIKTQYNKKLAETEMRALRAQMNPHFIFNCLNSINRYIIKNDHKTASLYLTKFAKLIRIILDNSETHEVALSQELEALHLYIDIEALRFDHKFRYEIEVDDAISPDTVMIPPMIIQPFVENAIWHGLLHKDTHGKLKISFALEDSLLVCIVEDDGVGRSKAQELKSKSATTRKSLGLKITADRLEMLYANFDMSGGVVFEDLFDETGNAAGTRVIIKIPVEI